MRQGALIGPIIIAIGLVIAAIAFAVVGALLQTADGSAELRLNRNEAELARQRGEIDTLRTDLRDAQVEIDRLSEEMAMQAARPQAMPVPAASEVTVAAPDVTGDDGVEDHGGVDAMTEVMRLAKARFNKGVTQPGNRVMLDLLGHPRDSYSADCQPVTQPRLKSLLETRQMGPITVTMIRPALDSVERILAKLQKTEPEIYTALGTAGALCARLIRGSSSSVSNHSWGTAIDLKLEGQLDGFADGGTQFGLLLLAELFNEEGWFWGATYSREDSMHFEVGVETLRKWQAEGKI
ncbi:M15 family metallopeptidase [Paracoccus lutimaris]|uniref:D-alanyl-D-alanine carboxypeptidase-like protein n=1 Tax=Paracoccus lutimaris TaxID=1490030 RepID=A0A368ZES1_9RHOB|nr:M15 family metallopeptidase [Paracoccus lutimaris]RCW89004.1 D-alanyl-D-alanine carboxypeptidase-like protein [Paracoccus lutimaris]